MDVRIFVIIAFVTIASTEPIQYRRSLDTTTPMVNKSASNPENIVSRETINHVRHQHQQQIGNIRVITEIDIKNLITLLNVSNINESIDLKPVTMLTTDGTKDSNMNEQSQFKRLDRNRNDDSKPITFPNDQHLRRIRWPTDSNNVIDVEAKTNGEHKSLIRFPNLESKFENGSPLQPPSPSSIAPPSMAPPNNAFKLNDTQLNEINNLVTIAPLTTSQPNDFILNQTAINMGFEPFIYIDDGIFRIKYLPKTENQTTHNDEIDIRLTELALSSSINKTGEEIAIILNDKQHPIDNVKLTTTNHHVINNIEIPFQWNETSTKGTSIQTKDENNVKEENSSPPHSPQSNTNNKEHRLYNGLPIFV